MLDKQGAEGGAGADRRFGRIFLSSGDEPPRDAGRNENKRGPDRIHGSGIWEIENLSISVAGIGAHALEIAPESLESSDRLLCANSGKSWR